MHKGSLDSSTNSQCVGWAVEDDRPVIPEVFVNGILSTIRCVPVDRPDLIAHGLPREAGFLLRHSRPLLLDDVVDVRFPGGGSLDRSPTTEHRERLASLLHGVGTGARCLEFGVLDRPLLPKSAYQVRYVDHASRTELVRQYTKAGATSNVDPADIQDVDFIWDHGSLSSVAGTGYDYCLASHVIEHVADPIGWLQEIALVLKPGGRLNLAIPEMTRTFDSYRTPTTPAAMLDAFRLGLTRPSFAQVFDHILGARPAGAGPPDPRVLAPAAYEAARRVARSDEYLDVHCHVWTFGTFKYCWDVVECLDLVALQLEEVQAPVKDSNEFIVYFTRKDPH